MCNTLPWPPDVPEIAAARVAKAARDVREVRADLARRHKRSSRELCRELEIPGKHALKDAHAALDDAVARAYGASGDMERLAFLAELNQQLAILETKGDSVLGPGLPVPYRNMPHVASDVIVLCRRLSSADRSEVFQNA